VKAGLEVVLRREKKGVRLRAISQEKIEAIKEALKQEASKASICQMFNIKRTTLYDYLNQGR